MSSATAETLQDAERELFGDLKTEFGYIEFDEEDIMPLQDEMYVQDHMNEFSEAMELMFDKKAGIKKPVYFDEGDYCVCCMDFGKLPDDAVMTIAETFIETLDKLSKEDNQ